MAETTNKNAGNAFDPLFSAPMSGIQIAAVTLSIARTYHRRIAAGMGLRMGLVLSVVGVCALAAAAALTLAPNARETS